MHLLQRMTYVYDKMTRNPKYRKWLSHSLVGPGGVVGLSISMWSIIIVAILLYFANANEWSHSTVKTILIVGLVFLILGFVIGFILDYKLQHHQLKKGFNSLSDKDIKKIVIGFVIAPFVIAIIAVLVLVVIVIIK